MLGEQSYLSSLNEIPRRYYLSLSNSPLCELHGFSDASESAYAGVVYMRTLDSIHGIQTSLINAKTKVECLHGLTVP